jgi:hypothetical protein
MQPVLQYRQLSIVILALFLLLLFVACSDTDLNIPNPKSMGMSEPLIEVYTPVTGSILPADTDFVLGFAVVRGREGAYIKLRIDKRRPVTLNNLSGKHHIDGLPAGPHTITITEYTHDGRLTGGQALIHVFMEKPR